MGVTPAVGTDCAFLDNMIMNLDVKDLQQQVMLTQVLS